MSTPQDDLVRKVAEAWVTCPADTQAQARAAIAVVQADTAEQVARLTVERDALAARLAAVGKVHVRTPVYDTDEHEEMGDAAMVLAWCCSECKDLDDISGERVHETWPCRTMRAAFPVQEAQEGQQ